MKRLLLLCWLVAGCGEIAAPCPLPKDVPRTDPRWQPLVQQGDTVGFYFTCPVR